MKTDRLTIQMVVIFIGAACLLSIGGLIVLSFLGRPVPEPLTTLGATAIGALGSMLARTSTESAPPSQESAASYPLPIALTAPSSLVKSSESEGIPPDATTPEAGGD